MPSLPVFTFQNLHDLLEECKDDISHRVYTRITDTLDFAYDNDDQAVIPAICWLILQARLGAKSIREIVNIFLSKVESVQSQQYNQYQEMVNVLFAQDAMG